MKRIRFILFIALPVLMNTPAFAEEAPAAKKWKNTGEFSVVSTNGNSKGTTTAAKNLFTYAWQRATLDLLAGGLGSKSGDSVTAEQYNASEKVTWTLVGKNYVYERLGWDKNRMAGIRNRYDASVGLGRILLDRPKDKLNTELGGGYINEEREAAHRNEFGAGRAYAKYIRTLSETASFSQDAEYLHNFKDTDGYRLNTETALIASLTTHVSLKASYVWKRVGKPAAGIGKDDTTTAVALIVNY